MMSSIVEIMDLTLYTSCFILRSIYSNTEMPTWRSNIMHNIEESYMFQRRGAIFRESKIKRFKEPAQ